MRFVRFGTTAMVICSFFLSTESHSQTNPDQGLTPYAIWEGGKIDQLDMVNGTLFSRIPLIDYPQRGALKLSFSMISNNLGWYGLNGTWAPGSGAATFYTIEDNAVSGGILGNCRNGFSFSVATADGTKHQGGIVSGTLPEGVNICSQVNTVVAETWDGSGLRVVARWPNNQDTIVDRDGVTHYPGGYLREDSNGNLITLNS